MKEVYFTPYQKNRKAKILSVIQDFHDTEGAIGPRIEAIAEKNNTSIYIVRRILKSAGLIGRKTTK